MPARLTRMKASYKEVRPDTVHMHCLGFSFLNFGYRVSKESVSSTHRKEIAVPHTYLPVPAKAARRRLQSKQARQKGKMFISTQLTNLQVQPRQFPVRELHEFQTSLKWHQPDIALRYRASFYLSAWTFDLKVVR